MESKKRIDFFLPRWSKWLIGIFAGLLLVGILASWYLSRHYKSIVSDKISERVNKASKGLYRIAIADMKINLLTGSASFSGVKLQADSAMYMALKDKKEAPAMRLYLFANNLKIEHLNLWKLLLVKKIDLGGVKIDSLNVKMVKERLPYENKDTSSTDLYARMKDRFKEVRIDQIVFNTFDLDFADGPTPHPLQLRQVHAQVSDFLIGPNSLADTNRVFYSKRIEINLPGFDYSIPESPYRLAFDNLRLDSRSRSALIHKIRLEPKLSKQQYFRNDKQNKALIYLNWDTLSVENWDMGLLFRERKLCAERLFLSGGKVIFRKDRRYQKDNVNKIGDAPHQQIMKLRQLISVDTVYVNRSTVQYRQVNETGTDEGVISFVHVNGTISNMTNDISRLSRNRYMRADLQALLMGKGRLHAVFGFDMRSENGAHTYKGRLGSMDAPAFNLILTPLLNLEIASGNIKGIQFDMQGNDLRNWGELRFDYNEFKVNVLGALSDDGERKKKGIVSFFVNKFVINDSNPDANEIYHIGDVEHKRVPEYSHFKTIWKSLQDGIAQCAGIGSDWLREKM